MIGVSTVVLSCVRTYYYVYYGIIMYGIITVIMYGIIVHDIIIFGSMGIVCLQAHVKRRKLLT